MEKDIMNMLKEIKPEADFSSSNDFAEDGLLDSIDIVSLISMIEEKYNIVIDGLDLLPENFASVETIKKLMIKSGAKE